MSTSQDHDVQDAGAVPALWWSIVGAALSTGIVGILTVGPAFLAVGSVLAVVGLLRPGLRHRSASMVLVGAAVAPLYLAWLNRSGPGAVCSVQGEVTTCSDRYSPWPFVVVALGLIAAGVLLARWSRAAATRPDERL